MAARAALNPAEIAQMYPLFFSCTSPMDPPSEVFHNQRYDQKEKTAQTSINFRVLKCFHESLWVLIILLICRSFPFSFPLRLQIGSNLKLEKKKPR